MRRFLALMLVVVLGLVGAPVGLVGAQEQCYSGNISPGGFAQVSNFTHLAGLSATSSTVFVIDPTYEFRVEATYPHTDLTHRHSGDMTWRSISLNVWHRRQYATSAYLMGAVTASVPEPYTICTRLIVSPTPTPTATAEPTATALPTATSTAEPAEPLPTTTLLIVPTVASLSFEELLQEQTLGLEWVSGRESGVAILAVLFIALAFAMVLPRRR